MKVQSLLAVPLLIAALTACGSEASAGDDDGIASADSGTSASPAPSDSPSATASLSQQERMLKFAQCMRSNGVDMADPKPGEPLTVKLDRSNPKFTAAYEKCKQYSPAGDGTQTLSPEQQQRMLDFTKCMREHGINMPDPDPNGGVGIKITPGSGINPDDPKFQSALEACRQYMPQRPSN
jgi:hypothetical protein